MGLELMHEPGEFVRCDQPVRHQRRPVSAASASTRVMFVKLSSVAT